MDSKIKWLINLLSGVANDKSRDNLSLIAQAANVSENDVYSLFNAIIR